MQSYISDPKLPRIPGYDMEAYIIARELFGRIVPDFSRRMHATRGWWVEGRAAGTYADMIAARFSAEEAEVAVDRVYPEEEQRVEAEQRYLNWLRGYDRKRDGSPISKQASEFTR